MSVPAIVVASLLGWTLLGLLVVHRIQPRLVRLALLVMVSVVAWPITLVGPRLRHGPDASPR